MKIIHAITSIDFSSGGPSKSVCDLACELALQGVEINITTKKSLNPYLKESPHKHLTLNFIQNESFKQAIGNIFLKETYHLLHGQGIWQKPIHDMAIYARSKHLPYIISPRGMLEPWALNFKKWKKKLALVLYQRKDIAKATCIHATGKMEATQLRKLGFKNTIAVIPNPVELKEKLNKIKTNKKRFAFIGRFHEIKNIENLIKAWSKINNKQDWELVLVGDGDAKYVQSLKTLVAGFKLQNVLFTGFLVGVEKTNIMQTIDVLVLPSFSENFGMVVGEALQNEIPVIASTGTPWEDLQTHQCGWWVNHDIETLAQTIQQAILLSDEELQQMGQRGRQLIKEKYSIEIVAKQMIQLYDWVINGGVKPEFVQL